MARATRARLARRCGRRVTTTSTRRDAPSPSSTTRRASSSRTLVTAPDNARYADVPGRTGALPAAPLASSSTRVVGAHVAVDADGVERPGDAFAQHAARHRRTEAGVGADEDQQRRHLGRDHAGALPHRRHRDVAAAEPDAPHGGLREGVGRGDGLRRVRKAVAARGRACAARTPREQALVRHRHADAPGGAGEDPIRRHAEQRRRQRGRHLDRATPRRAGAGVGVAGVHQHRRGRPRTQPIAGDHARAPPARGSW